MSFLRAVRRPLAGALLCTTIGCYSYAPLEGPRPETGDEVRVRIQPVAAESPPEDPLFPTEARDRVRTLEGRVLRPEPEGMVLVVRRAERRGAERFGSRLDTISVPEPRIEAIEKKEFSFWQSAAIAGVTVGGLYFLSVGLLDVSSGTDDSGGGPGETF